MTIICTPGATETFCLTQSLIVVCVVVGGLFFILIVTNIALGILLCMNTRAKSMRRHRVQDKTRNSAQKEKQLPLGTLRMVYKRQSSTERASNDDVSDTQAFKGRFHDTASGSHDSYESDDIADDEWKTIVESDSFHRFRHSSHSHLHKQKWEAVLSGQINKDTNCQGGLPSDNLNPRLAESGSRTAVISENRPSSQERGTDSERHVPSATGQRLLNDYPSKPEPINKIVDHLEICQDQRESRMTIVSSTETKHSINDWFPLGLGMDELKDVSFSTRHMSSRMPQSANNITNDIRFQTDMSSDWIPQFDVLYCRSSSLSDIKSHSPVETFQSLSTGNVGLSIRPTAVDAKLEVSPSRNNEHQELLETSNSKTGGTKTNGKIEIEAVTQQTIAERESPKHKSKNGKNESNSPSKRDGKLYKKKHERTRGEYRDKTKSFNGTTRISSKTPSPPPSPISVSFHDGILSQEIGDGFGNERLPAEWRYHNRLLTNGEPSSEAEIFPSKIGTDDRPGQYMSEDRKQNGVEPPRLDVIDENNVIDSNSKNDLESQRNPVQFGPQSRFNILACSISDDAKQSYFSRHFTSSIVQTQDDSIGMNSHQAFSKEAETCQHPEGVHILKQPDNDSCYSSRPVLGLPNIYEDPTDIHLNTYRQHDEDSNRNARLARRPERKRSFVHRLLNRPKQNKNSRILKNFHSEDFIHLDIDSLEANQGQAQHHIKHRILASRNAKDKTSRGRHANNSTHSKPHKPLTQTADNDYFPSFQFLLAQSQWKRAYTEHYSDLKSLPYFVPRFTLSEEDLDMYHDRSIPTIDDLVQNGTMKRLRAGKGMGKYYGNDDIGRPYPKTKDEPETKESLSIANTLSHQRVAGLPDNRNDIISEEQTTPTPCQNQSDNVLPSSKEKDHRFWSNDADILGFHTGVSDKYHSINARRESFGHIFLQHAKLGHNGDRSINSDKSRESSNSNIFTSDAIQTERKESLPDVDEYDGGNWDIHVLSPRSQSSREVDSVSSFALSDFDMGESDVDDISRGDCDDNNDEDNDDDINYDHKSEYARDGIRRDIQDVRL